MIKHMAILFALLTLSISTQAREVELSWDPMEGASKYEIQISNSSKFEQPLMTNQIDKPAFNTPLTIGQYYYRVRVIDRKGKAGKWSHPASLSVTPYAPELVDPQPGFEASYYEIPPEIVFSWKPVEGNLDYEILIYKTTGQKILEESTKETSFKTAKITEGEYLWKVRSVANKTLLSPYSEPRRFAISRKNLTAPELITPDKDGLSPAYREVNFSWKQDPATNYTDLYLEKLTSRDGAKLYKKKFQNISGSAFKADYEEPGKYRWFITTKEGKVTPGISSPPQEFEIRNDVLATGNYELEFSASPVSDLYAITSARQNGGAQGIAQDSKSNGLMYGFMGGYYFLNEVGLFFSTRTGSQTVENMTAYAQETDLQLRLRFGSKGFNQEFWLGYRVMDLVSPENTPTTLVTNFTTYGGLLGTRINATLLEGWKLQISGFYYKPTGNIEGYDGLAADIYGGTAGLKWNFMYQFWLGYRFSFERVAATFTTVNRSPTENSSWTMYRTEPVFISISFEH